jgi:hypothetical protein
MNPIKRKILIAVLGLGTIGGFGAGFASLARGSCARRAAFERHVAETCVDAARRADRDPADDRGDRRDHDHDRRRGRGHDRHPDRGEATEVR